MDLSRRKMRFGQNLGRIHLSRKAILEDEEFACKPERISKQMERTMDTHAMTYSEKVSSLKRTVQMIDGKPVRRRRKNPSSLRQAELRPIEGDSLVVQATKHEPSHSLRLSPSHLSESAINRRPRAVRFLRNMKQLSKFISILIGLWKRHASKVKEFLEDSVQMVDFELGGDDLLFDKTDFKADLRARISTETKETLSKPSWQRTADEIKHVEVALKNYPEIAVYPEHIQTLIARRGWYERYVGRRIIIRQGHPARCWYFILSGSVVMSQLAGENNISTTQCYLGRGDSFGEEALLTQTRRAATYVSQGTLELLVITDDDFFEIFRSGELSDPDDPVLSRSVALQGWPIEKLMQEPLKAKISYFKRGALMEKTDKDTEWLYIVQSGSCDVMKKLPFVQKKTPKLPIPVNVHNIDLLVDIDHHLEMERKFADLELKRQNEDLKRQKLLLNFIQYGIPIKTFYDDMLNSSYTTEQTSKKKRNKSGTDRTKLAYRRNPTLSFREGSIITEVIKENQQEYIDSSIMESASAWDASSTASINSIVEGSVLGEEVESTEKYVYVRIQTLVKGEVFGLASDLHEDSPDLLLISNGAECIMINRKYYWDHAPFDMKRILIKELSPYPSDGELQKSLDSFVKWNRQRKEVLKESMNNIKKRKEAKRLKSTNFH